VINNIKFRNKNIFLSWKWCKICKRKILF